MNFLRSRAERLAEHLRDAILRGELRDPLPATRVWSENLGVGRTTLDSALRELRREGLVTVVPGQRIRLNLVARAAAKRSARHPRIARVLYYAHDYPDALHLLCWVAPLSERLHRHEIDLTVERCTDARFRAIADSRDRGEELLLLLSLSPRHQRLFARSQRPSLIIGQPAPEMRLPFVRVDHAGAMRHATLALLRRGFSTVNLLDGKAAAPVIQQTANVFRSACAEWPHQPISARLVLMPLGLTALAMAARRFAASVKVPQGILVVSPIPVGMIQTSLMQYASRAARQVEIMGLFTTRTDIAVCPLPAHYPLPVDRVVKAVGDAAIHFFDHGTLPFLQKTIRVDLVAATHVD